jgi:hypothetical protein
MLPRSWRLAASKITMLDVENNPNLVGCAPLTSYPTSFNGTRLSGWCNNHAATLQYQQRRALASTLPKLLVGTGKYASAFNQTMKGLLAKIPALGTLIADGETSTLLSYKNMSYFVFMKVDLLEGVEYVTSLHSSLQSLSDVAAGLQPPYSNLENLFFWRRTCLGCKIFHVLFATQRQVECMTLLNCLQWHLTCIHCS